MKRKFIILLTLILVFSSGVSYAEENPKLQWLRDNKIVEGRLKGDGSIDLDLENTITRAEITKVLVAGLDLKNDKEVETFEDVKNHWASKYIEAAVADERKIIEGNGDGTFKPDAEVIISELAAMMVKTAKKDLTEEMKKNAVWPDSYINWAEELGIFKDIKLEDKSAQADRKTAFEMLYNTFEILGKTEKKAEDNKEKKPENTDDSKVPVGIQPNEKVECFTTISMPGIKSGKSSSVKSLYRVMLKYDSLKASSVTTKFDSTYNDGFLIIGYSPEQWKYLADAEFSYIYNGEEIVVEKENIKDGYIGIFLPKLRGKLLMSEEETICIYVTPKQFVPPLAEIMKQS